MNQTITTSPALSKLVLDFTNRGQARAALVEGWSPPEEHGTWAIGTESHLLVPLPSGHGPYLVTLNVVPFIVSGSVKSQELRLTMEGRFLAKSTLTEPRTIVCQIPADFVAGRQDIALELWHPDAISPMAVGESNDVRPLAILLQSIEITAAGPAGGTEIVLPRPAVPAERVPTFAIITQGNIANRMIQYMAALSVQARVPGLRIVNVKLPEWGIEVPDAPSMGSVAQESQEQYLDIETVAGLLRSKKIDRIEYSGFGQRIENFLDVEFYRSQFVTGVQPIRVFGPDVLLINIRAGEVLTALHQSYTVIPPLFYVDLVRSTGLRPVFMGQTEPNAYTDQLRALFPDAEFLPSGGILADFQTIRSAKNIVVAVSTFSWLAAWLSEAEQIHVPISGFLNPMQEPRVDLLPLDDPRYRFYLFPINRAVPLDRLVATHAAIDGYWRLVTPLMIETMRISRPRFERNMRDYLALFDADFYLGRWPEFRKALQHGGFSSALDHYIRVGFAANLEAFDLDREWYAREYSMAAFEVAQGDFVDLEHHYAAVGRFRGARPVPPPAADEVV